MDRESYYYQTIARKLFEIRGAPFVLSSNDLTEIERWEASRIPLRIVLEGMEAADAAAGKRTGTSARKKIRSLVFCRPFVLEAFSLCRERAVGKKADAAAKKDKKGEILEAVKAFLKDIDPQVAWLKAPYQRVLEILPGATEEALERAEEYIENRLVARAATEDLEEARKKAMSLFSDLRKEDLEKIFPISLVKHLREKYKIPHVAPFMY